MIYVIEDKIVFNPEDNTLSLQDNTDCQVTISNPARRILLLLIEHHGTVVQRDTLFQKVWDDFGLVSSNNNLNHCISKLRKVINTLGHSNDVIITVPKVGFLLKKEIIISTLKSPIFSAPMASSMTPEPPGDITDSLPPEEATVMPQHHKNETQQRPVISPQSHNIQKKNNITILIVIVSFTLILLTFSMALREQFHDPKARLKIATVGECALYSTAVIPASQKSNFIRLAHQFIDTHKVTCSPGNIFVFQSESIFSLIKTGTSRDFFAQCRVNKNNDAEACLSVYVNNRKNNDNR